MQLPFSQASPGGDHGSVSDVETCSDAYAMPVGTQPMLTAVHYLRGNRPCADVAAIWWHTTTTREYRYEPRTQHR